MIEQQHINTHVVESLPSHVVPLDRSPSGSLPDIIQLPVPTECQRTGEPHTWFPLCGTRFFLFCSVQPHSWCNSPAWSTGIDRRGWSVPETEECCFWTSRRCCCQWGRGRSSSSCWSSRTMASNETEHTWSLLSMWWFLFRTMSLLMSISLSSIASLQV